MTSQPSLPLGSLDPDEWDAAAAELLWTSLTCAFGVPWRQHFKGERCPACVAAVDEGRARFAALVAAGLMDAEGYTPNERRMQAKGRLRKAAWKARQAA